MGLNPFAGPILPLENSLEAKDGPGDLFEKKTRPGAFYEFSGNKCGEGEKIRYEVHRSFLLMHSSGECIQLKTEWPVCPDKARPLDKAVASAVTTSLAYLLRDLLCMPRVAEGDDLAGREDQPEQVQPSIKKTIGFEGSKKLVDLAARKKVCLEDYMEKLGCFGEAADLTPDQARKIWAALSESPAATPGNGCIKASI